MSRKSCANWKALKRSGKCNISVPPQVPLRSSTNPSLPERAITYRKYLLLGYLQRGTGKDPIHYGIQGWERGRGESELRLAEREAEKQTDREGSLVRCV